MNAMRVGIFALMRPVMTSTEGRCVATIRCNPTARASCARRQMRGSTSSPQVIIRSANSSMTITMRGKASSSGRWVARKAS